MEAIGSDKPVKALRYRAKHKTVPNGRPNSTVGRPPKYDDPAIVQKKIDAYFEGCRRGNKVISITGLALALNMTMTTLWEYSEKPEFSEILKIAKLRVENFYEERLPHPNATGSIFALKQFGWKDKVEVEQTVNVTIGKAREELAQIPYEQIKASLAMLEAPVIENEMEKIESEENAQSE